MTLVTRTILILTLLLALVNGAYAQEAATATTEPASTSTATTSTKSETTRGTAAKSADSEAAATEASTETSEQAAPSSLETRSMFLNLLGQYPPELGTILALDPTLLSNDAFLTAYPDLSKFVARHPEVRHNPRFYLDNYVVERRSNTLDDILQGIFIFGMFIFFAFVLSWLLRTLVEQKRWSRLSRTQTEVHNKILDRFGTSTELLEYMKTPAGTKFLESAPIPLHEVAPSAQSGPNARVLWSIQLGVVVAAAAIGLLAASGHFDKESARGLFAMGIIAFSIGAGFIASAFISLFVSRRIGAWQSPDADTLSSGSVR
jgi:hypothetical protein